MTDSTDDRVNDGNNYKGLMKASDYKAKREAVIHGNVSADTLAERKIAAAAAVLEKDRAAKEQAEKDRQQREEARREKLKRELQEADADAADAKEAPEGGKKKKKKKPAAGVTLSFDADEEG